MSWQVHRLCETRVLWFWCFLLLLETTFQYVYLHLQSLQSSDSEVWTLSPYNLIKLSNQRTWGWHLNVSSYHSVDGTAKGFEIVLQEQNRFGGKCGKGSTEITQPREEIWEWERKTSDGCSRSQGRGMPLPYRNWMCQ